MAKAEAQAEVNRRGVLARDIGAAAALDELDPGIGAPIADESTVAACIEAWAELVGLCLSEDRSEARHRCD